MAYVEKLEDRDLYYVECPHCNKRVALNVGPTAFDNNLRLTSDVYCDNCETRFRPFISEDNLELLRSKIVSHPYKP